MIFTSSLFGVHMFSIFGRDGLLMVLISMEEEKDDSRNNFLCTCLHIERALARGHEV